MLACYDWFFTRDYGGNFTSKDIIEDDTLIFQFFRQRHRLTNDVFYFYLGEQGPELQAGVTLTSSGPPHPRKSVSRQEIHESKNQILSLQRQTRMPPSKNTKSSMSMATELPTASRICKCASLKKI